MKKHLSRILLILILCASLCAGLLALGAADPAAGPVYTVDEPYVYPILPGTDEWRAMDSLSEKIAACHVDVDLMESMTTPALLETVLTYPLLINLWAYTDEEVAFRQVSSYCEGLRLLVEREDAAECLLEFARDPERVAHIRENEVLQECFIRAIAWYVGVTPEEVDAAMEPTAATQPDAARREFPAG